MSCNRNKNVANCVDNATELLHCITVSKREKALKKLLEGKHDKHFTFDELVAILSREGFYRDGGEGSHQVWRHDDERKITLVRHGNTIKPIYVKTARELLK